MTEAVTRVACVILTHQSESGLSCFWAKRLLQRSFLGGYYAFPGGCVEDTDAATAHNFAYDVGAVHKVWLPWFGAAARELFEEVGVLITHEQGVLMAHDPVLATLRAKLNKGLLEFDDVLRHLNVHLDFSRFEPSGRWDTPPWMKSTSSTEFFHVRLDDVGLQELESLPSLILAQELEHAAWIAPDHAIVSNLEARVMTTAPTLAMLAHVQRPRAKRCDQGDRIEDLVHACLRPGGFYVLPMQSPTIPPATHTNCIVVGDERVVVIDPGSDHDHDLDMLFALIDAVADHGRRLEAVVLTHHHVDHVCGIPKLRARYGQELEVWAHAETARWMESTHHGEVTRTLMDREVLRLGPKHKLMCVHTPGHASGHLAFVHQGINHAFVGDLVASQGTVVVRPPEGHMGDYMASLELMRSLDVQVMYPAHGEAILAPQAKLIYYIAHRKEREASVLEALRTHQQTKGWANAIDLVPLVYKDVPQAIWPVAAFSLLAHLEHLVEEGLVVRHKDLFLACVS